jgi:hypothetical protein
MKASLVCQLDVVYDLACLVGYFYTVSTLSKDVSNITSFNIDADHMFRKSNGSSI